MTLWQGPQLEGHHQLLFTHCQQLNHYNIIPNVGVWGSLCSTVQTASGTLRTLLVSIPGRGCGMNGWRGAGPAAAQWSPDGRTLRTCTDR